MNSNIFNKQSSENNSHSKTLTYILCEGFTLTYVLTIIWKWFSIL